MIQRIYLDLEQTLLEIDTIITVNWGDGSANSTYTSNLIDDISHDYIVSGNYTITISSHTPSLGGVGDITQALIVNVPNILTSNGEVREFNCNASYIIPNIEVPQLDVYVVSSLKVLSDVGLVNTYMLNTQVMLKDIIQNDYLNLYPVWRAYALIDNSNQDRIFVDTIDNDPVTNIHFIYDTSNTTYATIDNIDCTLFMLYRQSNVSLNTINDIYYRTLSVKVRGNMNLYNRIELSLYNDLIVIDNTTQPILVDTIDDIEIYEWEYQLTDEPEIRGVQFKLLALDTSIGINTDTTTICNSITINVLSNLTSVETIVESSELEVYCNSHFINKNALVSNLGTLSSLSEDNDTVVLNESTTITLETLMTLNVDHIIVYGDYNIFQRLSYDSYEIMDHPHKSGTNVYKLKINTAGIGSEIVLSISSGNIGTIYGIEGYIRSDNLEHLTITEITYVPTGLNILTNENIRLQSEYFDANTMQNSQHIVTLSKDIDPYDLKIGYTGICNTIYGNINISGTGV